MLWWEAELLEELLLGELRRGQRGGGGGGETVSLKDLQHSTAVVVAAMKERQWSGPSHRW